MSRGPDSDQAAATADTPAPRRLSRRRRAAFVIVYFLGVIVFVAGALELIVRAMGTAPPLKIRYEKNAADPVLPFRPIPNLTHTFDAPSKEYVSEWRHNSMGYRDVEHPIEKPAGMFRIFAMGDSFTWGAGVEFEDTYLNVLERKLNQRGGDHPPVEIVKAGIYAYFPAAQRLLLEHDGARFSPDLVILQFYPNDVMETALGLDNIRPTEEGYLMTQEARDLGRVGQWLYMNSHVARIFLRQHIDNKLYERVLLDPDEIYKAHSRYGPQWLEIEAELTKMKELCDAMGARFVLIHIPEKDLDRQGADVPPARLAAWADRNGVTFINLLPALRSAQAAPDSPPLYWPVDTHCTAAGYTVIADTLFSELTHQSLIP